MSSVLMLERQNQQVLRTCDPGVSRIIETAAPAGTVQNMFRSKAPALSMDYQKLNREVFGFQSFRPGQEAVIAALDSHQAALAVFPTGGGKSLCYQLPALLYDGVTIVVSPLIALMKDQIDFLTRCGVPAARMDSTLNLAETQDINNRLRAGTLKLLYVAPERFNNERFMGVMRSIHISLFAVDEAHCISEWGHNFRPDYLKLAHVAQDLGVERVLALTATATPSVVEDICAAFHIPKECAIVTGFYRRNLQIEATPVEAEDRDALIISRITSRPPGSTIVYVTLQKQAERLANVLQDAGLPARPYHAGMNDDIRSEVQDWWMQSMNGIVVATIAFGMGIDKAAVRYVYHYNLPKSLESYSQEIGRAGRDGEQSIVEMLACAEDVPVLANFAYGDTPSEQSILRLLQELLSMPVDFDVNQYELSNRFDIRHLVLRTTLTYLELLGILRQGTPFYAAYDVALLRDLDDIIAEFKGEPAQLVRDIFRNARFGKKYYRVPPVEMAEKLMKEQRRIVRCLEYLEEHGWAELHMADIRTRYTRLTNPNIEELHAELMHRFNRREEREIQRIQSIFTLLGSESCITNGLAQYFGEYREAPCGHCTYCRTGQAVNVHEARTMTTIPDSFPVDEWSELRFKHPDGLGEPRQAARFLCGLSSPYTSLKKLTRHKLFGILENMDFRLVMARC